MNIIADTHCHTIASTHAYSTVTEIASAAYKAGLYAVAVTDHARTMPGAPGRWYFKNLQVIPRWLEGVLLLRGAEVNVLDSDGTLDEPPKILDCLDWVVASIHKEVYTGEHDRDACTNAWMKVAQNPYVKVIGHSGSDLFQYDYETVIKEFGRQGKLVEINENTFNVRQASVPHCKEIALLCKKHGVRVIVNSDAHFHTMVGKVDRSLALLHEINFPPELIVNGDKDRFEQFLRENTHVFQSSQE